MAICENRKMNTTLCCWLILMSMLTYLAGFAAYGAIDAAFRNTGNITNASQDTGLSSPNAQIGIFAVTLFSACLLGFALACRETPQPKNDEKRPLTAPPPRLN